MINKALLILIGQLSTTIYNRKTRCIEVGAAKVDKENIHKCPRTHFFTSVTVLSSEWADKQAIFYFST